MKTDVSLAKNIYTRMVAKSLKIPDLEKAAGIRTMALRKILSGSSKQPSVGTLIAIAKALHCSVEDLLPSSNVQEDNFPKNRKILLKGVHKHPNSFVELSQALHKKLIEKGKKITNGQYIKFVEEIFIHSLQKDPNKIDTDHLEWFVNLINNRD